MEAGEAADLVASQVLSTYRKRILKNKQLPSKEWTIVSGLVAYEPRTGTSTVLVVACGTKCVGPRLARAGDGTIVLDSHAETLVMRGFRRLLMHDLAHLENPAGLLERAERDGVARLKPAIELHMYVSDSPCGCAAVVPRVGDRSTRETGAIFLSSNHDPSLDKNPTLLATKPGRSDMREEDRTKSMSCSDKLLRRCWVGIEGRLLSSRLESSLFLTSLILGKDALLSALETIETLPDPNEMDEAETRVTRACREALVDRAERFLPELEGSTRSRLSVRVARNTSFEGSKQRVDSATRLGVKRVKLEENDALSPSRSLSTHPQGYSATWIARGWSPKRAKLEGCEFLSNGLLNGVSRARLLAPNPDHEALCSDLSKIRLAKTFLQSFGGGATVSDARETETSETYEAMKTRATREDFRARRARFLSVFAEWSSNHPPANAFPCSREPIGASAEKPPATDRVEDKKAREDDLGANLVQS